MQPSAPGCIPRRAAHGAALCCLGDVVRWRAAQGVWEVFGHASVAITGDVDETSVQRGFSGGAGSVQRRTLIKVGGQTRWSNVKTILKQDYFEFSPGR